MLGHLRVLDLCDERGQLCGQMLADLGAEVILIEPPAGTHTRQLSPFKEDTRGENRSLTHWTLNRGKKSVVLDLTAGEGKAHFERLVADSDFVIESFEPGYLASLGLGYDDLARINPRIIVVSITPFGQTGPKAKDAASDLTVLASSGVLFITGDDDRPPVRVVIPQAFLHASAEGAAGALIAHYGRERDGLGQHIDVSAQAATLMATQSLALAHGWGEQQVMRASGGLKLGPLYLRLVNPCKDGFVSVTFLFGSAIGPFTRRLMEVMCEQGYVDEATRDKDWIGYTNLILSGQEPVSELYRCIEAVTEFTKGHTKQELFELALQRGLLIVPVSTTEDVVHSPQLEAREYWTPVEHPDLGKSFLYPGPFAKFSATPIRYTTPAPALGAHTVEVLGQRERPKPPVPPAPTTRAMPLAGIKVLDFMWVMAGPMGSRYLTDYGATHVRVDSPSRLDTAHTIQPFKDGVPGPGRSGLFANVNAGKLGISINMANPKGRELAKRLAAWADVVLDSYSPKAMRNWGLHYDELRKINPTVIQLSSCLNGQYGPTSTLAGFGTMGAQLAGFGELAGWPDRPPAGPFGAYTDYVAPKFIAAAIMAALEHRRRTGEGQFIDLAQGEASLHFLTPAFLDYTVNGRVMTRAGNDSPEYAPHGVYPVQGNDRWVAIVAETEAQWQALARAAGHPEWLTDGRFATMEARLANRRPLDDLIAAWTAPQPVEAIEEALRAARVPVHRVADNADLFADPQLQHRGHFVTVEHPDLGPVPIESSRMRFSATPSVVTRPGPTFGQDNEHVLRDLLGLSDDEIVEYIAEGALE